MIKEPTANQIVWGRVLGSAAAGEKNKLAPVVTATVDSVTVAWSLVNRPYGGYRGNGKSGIASFSEEAAPPRLGRFSFCFSSFSSKYCLVFMYTYIQILHIYIYITVHWCLLGEVRGSTSSLWKDDTLVVMRSVNVC